METVEWKFYDYDLALWDDFAPTPQTVFDDARRWLAARLPLTLPVDAVQFHAMRDDPCSAAVTLVLICPPEIADWLYEHGQSPY